MPSLSFSCISLFYLEKKETIKKEVCRMVKSAMQKSQNKEDALRCLPEKTVFITNIGTEIVLGPEFSPKRE